MEVTMRSLYSTFFHASEKDGGDNATAMNPLILSFVSSLWHVSIWRSHSELPLSLLLLTEATWQTNAVEQNAVLTCKAHRFSRNKSGK